MPGKMTAREIAYDVFTVPNAMTATRAAVIPWLYKRVREDPGKHWWEAGVFAFTDKGDGWAASQEDKGEKWARRGFRRSNSGRIGDPIVDTGFGGAMMHAGMEGGAIPRRMGYAGLAQKAGKSAISIYGTATGHELLVSYTGKLGEVMTVAGFGTRMGAEGISNPTLRRAARVGSEALAWGGLSLSTIAAVGYARDSEILPTERTTFENRVEAVSEQIVGIPKMVMDAIRSQGALNTTPES